MYLSALATYRSDGARALTQWTLTQWTQRGATSLRRENLVSTSDLARTYTLKHSEILPPLYSARHAYRGHSELAYQNHLALDHPHVVEPLLVASGLTLSFDPTEHRD